MGNVRLSWREYDVLLDVLINHHHLFKEFPPQKLNQSPKGRIPKERIFKERFPKLKARLPNHQSPKGRIPQERLKFLKLKDRLLKLGCLVHLCLLMLLRIRKILQLYFFHELHKTLLWVSTKQI